MNTKTLSIYILSSLILVSFVLLSACSTPVALAQPDTVKSAGEDASRTWEIDADDIAAAREAALTLSQIYAAVEADLEEEGDLRTWEIDADDIAAAREAALTLSQIYAAVEVELEEEDVLRTWEIDADDIAAAREAALTLSQIFEAVSP